MSIGALMSSIMCSNMIIQNQIRIRKEKKEREEEEKIKPTFQSTLNKERKKGR